MLRFVGLFSLCLFMIDRILGTCSFGFALQAQASGKAVSDDGSCCRSVILNRESVDFDAVLTSNLP